MPPFVIGVVLVTFALFAVGVVLYFVVREEPQHEDYYIPQEEPTRMTESEKTDPATSTVSEVDARLQPDAGAR